MSLQKALVIGINYGPEHSGIAPYTTGACEHLAAEGVKVRVVTGVPHYPSWSIPEEYRRRLRTREVVNGVAVARLLHFVPTKQTALHRAIYELTFALHAGWSSRRWRGDTVVAVIPSLLSAVTAALIARRAEAKLVVWVQDSMAAAAQQSGITGGGWAARMLRPIESWILNRASSVVVVSDSFRGHAESFGVLPERIEVIRNWSHVSAPQADRDTVRARQSWEGKTVVLHAGNMGLKQGLERVVFAARQCLRTDPELLFVLMGDGNQRAALEDLAGDLPNLVFMDPVSGEDFMDTLAAADLLLVCEGRSVVDMSLPSKLTSYMVAGRPIIGAVRSDGATARELQHSQAGCVVDGDTELDLLRTINELRGNPDEMRLLGKRGEAYATSDLSPSSSLSKIAELVSTP